MNERIKELARQAYIKDSLKQNPKWKESEIYHCLMNELDSFFEQFGELIIGEFISLMKAEKTYYDNPGTYEPESYYIRMEAKAAAFDDAIRIIKNHFGVEE